MADGERKDFQWMKKEEMGERQGWRSGVGWSGSVPDQRHSFQQSSQITKNRQKVEPGDNPG